MASFVVRVLSRIQLGSRPLFPWFSLNYSSFTVTFDVLDCSLVISETRISSGSKFKLPRRGIFVRTCVWKWRKILSFLWWSSYRDGIPPSPCSQDRVIYWELILSPASESPVMASARAFWWFSHGGKQTLRAGACKREDTWLSLTYNNLLSSDSFCTLRGRVGEKDQSSYRFHRLISLQNPTVSQECLLHWELDFILTLGGGGEGMSDIQTIANDVTAAGVTGGLQLIFPPFCASKPLAPQPKLQDKTHGYDPPNRLPQGSGFTRSPPGSLATVQCQRLGTCLAGLFPLLAPTCIDEDRLSFIEDPHLLLLAPSLPSSSSL